MEELTEAKTNLVREAQYTHFGRELRALQRGESLPKNSPILKLSPFLSEGLLKVEGRLQMANL